MVARQHSVCYRQAAMSEHEEDRDSGDPDDETSSGIEPLPDAEGSEEDLEINGYRLVSELQRGGQAVVFVAQQKSTGRKVALKLMFSGPFASDVERQRMDQEVRILAALDHPNIVSVIDRGETTDGSQYFVMNYVDGRPLNEFLDDHRRDHGQPEQVADVKELLRIFKRICEAVNAAHLRGIVHRDLKPANIVIDAYGEPHILDFGLAHAAVAQGAGPADSPTSSGEFVGSLEWASPEQARGDASKIDTRTDVYALGVILYEMLTGDFPYDVFGDLNEALNHIVNTRPRAPSKVLIEARMQDKSAAPAGPPAVDEALDAIALKALAKARDERYQTAGELARDIDRYLEGKRSVEAPRGLLLRVALVAVLVGLVAGVFAFFVRQHASRKPAQVEVAYDRDTYGYAVEGPSVYFIFEADRYETVRHEDGRLDSLKSIGPIDRISVVGAFNDWKRDRGDWMMHQRDDRRWELRKSLSLFASREEWPFKFLINGAIWVGAPANAANREVVVTDTATFNLVLVNPAGSDGTATKVTRVYREQVNAAWPGQGANLVVDERGRYHFTFTHLPPGVRVTDLEPLRGLPLSSLDISEAKVTDLSPLKDMTSLTELRVSDGTFAALTAGLMSALRAYDFDGAQAALDAAFRDLVGVPAFAHARDLLAESIVNLRSARAAPNQPPPERRSFKGHRYAFVLFPMNAGDARAFAQHCGGYLASVTSEEENTWLAKTFGMASLGRFLWLGGTDEGSESYWRWQNGEGWRYEHWNKPEPNNNNGNEHALAMKPDGWWIDADGYSLQLPFIVEWSE